MRACAGECSVHPRARETQRPPPGDWRVWGYVAGRGAGKTRAGAEWIQQRVEDGVMKLGCLIADGERHPGRAGRRALGAALRCTARESARFEPSKGRVTWPNGAWAICRAARSPSARGLNVDTLWADELACWQRAESTWKLVMLGLRAGGNPQALITTTPRRVAVLKEILAEATTVRTTDTTYANQCISPRHSSARSWACMRIRGWGGRRSMPSSWRRRRACGFPTSTRPSMFRSRLSIILGFKCDVRLTRELAAHGGGFLSGSTEYGGRQAAGHGFRRISCI